MDPYLEQTVIWHDFQKRFLPTAAALLAAQVLPRYIVVIDEHVYLRDAETDSRYLVGRPDLSVSELRVESVLAEQGIATAIVDAPAEVRVPELDEEREAFLTVRDRLNREVVTVIELLSPTNKRSGENRRRYLSKRADVLSSNVHLVEIDLLRCGTPMPVIHRPECEYSVLVSRATERPRAGFWPIQLRDALPVIPVPLHAGDKAARLDIRAVIDRVYDEAGYRYFLYDHSPDPPWNAADEEWAKRMQAESPPTP
jgi:hypothetical protein